MLILFALAPQARATKLDLSSDIDIKAANYTNLITGSRGQGQALYSENAALGFIIKDIKLEKTDNSSMDVGIVLNSVGAGGASTTTLNAAQFREAASRYPHTDGTPYIKEAYIRVYKFLNKKLTATFGRQSFTLGQGITLSDDGLGLPGAHLEAEKLYRGIKGEAFFFRPYKDSDFVRIYGGGIYYPSNEGLWHLYHFRENGAQAAAEPGHNSVSRTKEFTGVRYFLNYNQLNFDGEFTLQKGASKKTGGGKAEYNGHAFLIKGVWNQKLGLFGPSRMRLVYGKSSGNPGQVSDKDKAFFPTFGHRFKGVEREGYGEIAGASLYDIIQTSDTVNGLPAGVSGLNIINIGADLPYKKLVFSVDFYKFRASQNANGGSTQIGSELDFRAAYSLGDSLRLKAVYAVFNPMGLYPAADSIKLVSLALAAKF
ncbi:MAG: alginate export family protein [Elusimicrobia bacterium]|nr:alginate export family protein [Elusimicrobiota bacterium]